MQRYSKHILVLTAAFGVGSAYKLSETMFGVPAAESAVIGDVERELDLTSPMNIIGMIVTMIAVMIAAGGGIGGGGVLVPTYIFILGFEPKIAIPLSTITILGSSLTNLLLNFSKRHPLADRPLIDWDMMLVMEPLTIAGTVLGSFINVLCPPWLLCVLLVVLLTLTTLKTLRKGIKMYHDETAMRGACDADSALLGELREEAQPLSPDSARADQRSEFQKKIIAFEDASEEVLYDAQKASMLGDLIESERHHSIPKIAVMLLLTMGVLGLTVFKGGHGVNVLQIECGTWQYWAISTAVLPFVLFISLLARKYLVSKWRMKRILGFQYVDGDIEWNEKHTILYPAICSVAGLCAGLFGIGGGIVKGPLMLEMGTAPAVASATSATMILLTSSSAAVSYFLFNSLNLHFAPCLFAIGFVFTLFGQKVLNHFVKKHNRSSLIVLIIATTVGLSAIAMGIQSGGSLIEFIRGEQVKPSGLCV